MKGENNKKRNKEKQTQRCIFYNFFLAFPSPKREREKSSHSVFTFVKETFIVTLMNAGLFCFLRKEDFLSCGLRRPRGVLPSWSSGVGKNYQTLPKNKKKIAKKKIKCFHFCQTTFNTSLNLSTQLFWVNTIIHSAPFTRPETQRACSRLRKLYFKYRKVGNLRRSLFICSNSPKRKSDTRE